MLQQLYPKKSLQCTLDMMLGDKQVWSGRRGIDQNLLHHLERESQALQPIPIRYID
jgi:hypothetical protein